MTRPRIRTLKPEMWQDERVGLVSRDARLLFIGLITFADDEGRMRAMPSAILGHVFPYDNDAPRKLEGWWAELEKVGLVLRYQHAEITYACLPGWEKHQRINRARDSELPTPPSVNGHGRAHDTITETVVRET